MEWAGLVPLFPLIGFLAISLGRKAIGKKLAGWLGTAMIAATPLSTATSGVRVEREFVDYEYR